MSRHIKIVTAAALCIVGLSACATLASLLNQPATQYQVAIAQLCAKLAPAVSASSASVQNALCATPPTSKPTPAQVAALAKLALAGSKP